MFLHYIFILSLLGTQVLCNPFENGDDDEGELNNQRYDFILQFINNHALRGKRYSRK